MTDKPANETIFRLGMVFREAGPCGNLESVRLEGEMEGQDIYMDLSEGDLAIRFEQPRSKRISGRAKENLFP